MNDVYHLNPELLKGQPKNTIGEDVESQSILVPKRYTNLDDALNSEKPFFMRSETAIEYDGPSGLLRSKLISTDAIKCSTHNIENYNSINKKPLDSDLFYASIGKISQTDLEKKLTNLSQNQIQEYCKLMQINKKVFENEISYSYWEAIEGYNRTIIADSAIKGRYHLFTERHRGFGDPHHVTSNYIIFDNGQVICPSKYKLPQIFLDDIENVIEFYEKIRHLGNFNPNHCPIVEFQTDFDLNHYFLQYHRTRDFQEPSFTLDREPEEGETVAEFVRGVTSQNGIEGILYLILPNKNKHASSNLKFYYDIVMESVNRELKLKKTSVCFIDHGQNIQLMHVSRSHGGRSMLFKPEVFLSMPKNSLFTKEEKQKMVYDSQHGILTGIAFRVISDGRKAYVKKLGKLDVLPHENPKWY